MITYPSTHGVFEAAVGELCGMIHDAGGQVYVDGANLNALVGHARPGEFGADVSHLNLHKTFCIPHGGGGPGVGPDRRRVPTWPRSCPDIRSIDDAPVGAVSAAPFGSAGILPIPWMYLEMMGGAGLTAATSVAIVSANYVADAPRRITSRCCIAASNGRVAHECIIDLRQITKDTDVTVDDIAKRLMDYGFHAPTMSFPVAGTLMIEPTESETLRELDRFCDAMIAIRGEIDGSPPASGQSRTAHFATRRTPPRNCSATGIVRTRATVGAFPLDTLRVSKYFPPVSRIDGAYGDRNLVCSLRTARGVRQLDLSAGSRSASTSEVGWCMADGDPIVRDVQPVRSAAVGHDQVVRAVPQGRRRIPRGVENFNRTMENLNETTERINRLVADIETPIRAAIPQLTRTVEGGRRDDAGRQRAGDGRCAGSRTAGRDTVHAGVRPAARPDRPVQRRARRGVAAVSAR